MLKVLYEDVHIIVVDKPAGVESQSAKGFQADMVSQIRVHIHKFSTINPTKSPKGQPPYVGVIHRLDKPVRGVMVYAKTQKAAARLSAQVQKGEMRKIYAAVVCGKPVDNCGQYVDFLLKDGQNRGSRIVDKSVDGGKEARLNYQVLGQAKWENGAVSEGGLEVSLLDIELLTGRYHQIRAQMAGHGTPIFGDNRYGNGAGGGKGLPLALCARKLSFLHPETGERMEFEVRPEGGAFELFGEVWGRKGRDF